MAGADLCDTTWNPVALDWARICVPAPAPALPVVRREAAWLRTWPPAGAAAGAGSRPATGIATAAPAAVPEAGWFASTRDLLAGLTVIEVHAATPELAAVLARMRDPSR